MTRRWIGTSLALAVVIVGCGDNGGGRPATATATATPVNTATASPTVTPTPLPTNTPTPTLPIGAIVTFFGLATADDFAVLPIGTDDHGRPIYERPTGQTFSLVIEGKPGGNRHAVGFSAFNYDPSNPAVRPDLQVIVSRPLGNGSVAVCDNGTPTFGGVPASPNFSETREISNAINDLGCRFNDGTGNPAGRGDSDACTTFLDGDYHFVDRNSGVQFCARIASPFGFALGDTIVSARLRDIDGVVGQTSEIVVRVNPNAVGTPSATRSAEPTDTPTFTPTPVGTPGADAVISYLGLAAADDAVIPAINVDNEGRPIFRTRYGRAFALVVEAKPAAGGLPIGRTAFNYDPQDPSVRPDLQVIVSNPLGDGSPAVCDNGMPDFGGVPASPDFTQTPDISNAINDLGCRTNDGTGNPSARGAADACTRFTDGSFHFVDSTSTEQFCIPIQGYYNFPVGDTIVSARIRSGQVQQMVVRVKRPG